MPFALAGNGESFAAGLDTSRLGSEWRDDERGACLGRATSSDSATLVVAVSVIDTNT